MLTESADYSSQHTNEHPLDAVRRLDTDVTLTREDIFDLRMSLQRVDNEIGKLWAEVDRRNERERKRQDQARELLWSTLRSMVKWFVMVALASLAWFVRKAVEHE